MSSRPWLQWSEGAAEPVLAVLAGEDRAEWRDFALCAEADPEAFFPEKGGSTKDAKKVCRRCPVTAECLEFALDRNERCGIYGGKSERERRKILRDRRAA
jgi:WhiB family redox-sensing transcriptional regulator